MARIYVSEYDRLAPAYGGGLGQVVQEPEIALQSIAITASSTLTAAFNGGTRIIRVHTDAICAIKIGPSPTAIVAGDTGTKRMVAGQTEYFGVVPGDKLAVIAST